jgi:hypothetical protein
MMESAMGTKQDRHANERDRNKNSNSTEERMRMRTGIQAWYAPQREEQSTHYRKAESNSSLTGSVSGTPIQARQARQ